MEQDLSKMQLKHYDTMKCIEKEYNDEKICFIIQNIISKIKLTRYLIF